MKLDKKTYICEFYLLEMKGIGEMLVNFAVVCSLVVLVTYTPGLVPL